MSSRAVAALCYVPVPGAAFLAPLASRGDRLVRFHAWQGGTLTLLALLAFWALGLVDRAVGIRPVLGIAAVAALAGLAYGAVQAARGRFARIRPVWDLVALLPHRKPMRAS